MKWLAIILLLATLNAGAQNKKDQQLVERTYALSHTVFGSKDSAALEDLFATTLSYGHSHGKLQTRAEALASIAKNTSTYNDTAVSNIKVFIKGKTAIVRHLFVAKEVKKDGSITPLNFSMLLVWVKEKGKWRLMARQAVSVS
jgi:ketosteroid isomerase-like protein